MSNVRLRRLTADHRKLQEYVRLHPRVRLVQADGDPPERYQLEYRIRSVRMVDGEVQDTTSHLVEIHLPRNYPRTPPQCRMLSPVFHPNIAPHAICVGDHWSSGEPLQSIVTRIGEMLAYQSYNVKSPLNGEAARWVEANKARFPLDPVSLLPEEEDPEVVNGNSASLKGEYPTAGAQAESSRPTESEPSLDSKAGSSPPSQANDASDPPTGEKLQAVCPHCQTRYQVSVELVGRKSRCKQCREVFSIASAP